MSTLRWTHPGNDATSFTAHIGQEPGVYDTHVDIGLPVCIYSAELSNLPIGGVMALTAVNAAGESDYSNELPEPASGLVFGLMLLAWLTHRHNRRD